VVCHCDGGHSELDNSIHKLANSGGAIEHRIFGVVVEVDEIRVTQVSNLALFSSLKPESAVAQSLQRDLQILRVIGLVSNPLPAQWVLEGEPNGMQPLPI
jgi:hypothetical protein